MTVRERKFANETVVIEKGREKIESKGFKIDQRLTRYKIHLLVNICSFIHSVRSVLKCG